MPNETELCLPCKNCGHVTPHEYMRTGFCNYDFCRCTKYEPDDSPRARAHAALDRFLNTAMDDPYRGGIWNQFRADVARASEEQPR